MIFRIFIFCYTPQCLDLPVSNIAQDKYRKRFSFLFIHARFFYRFFLAAFKNFSSGSNKKAGPAKLQLTNTCNNKFDFKK